MDKNAPKALKQIKDPYHLSLLSYQALRFVISQPQEILSKQLINRAVRPVTEKSTLDSCQVITAAFMEDEIHPFYKQRAERCSALLTPHTGSKFPGERKTEIEC